MRASALALALAFAALASACGPPRLDEVELDHEMDASESAETGDAALLRPSWHQDVAPIIHTRCVGCHQEGGIAPFALDDYDTASTWAAQISSALSDQSMPPWGAHDTPECQPKHQWVDDLRLSEAELATVLDWEEIGAPEGDPNDAAPLPSTGVPGLADPDGVFPIPSPITVQGPFDVYSCISVDPGFEQEVWITGAQVLVDNAEIVHHVIYMLDETGASAELAGPDGSYPCEALHEQVSWLGSYFPGAGPTLMPQGAGVPVPPGARLVLSFHYHPTGLGQDVDQSSLALRWTTEPPDYDAIITAVGNAATAAQGLHWGPDDPDGIPTFWIPAGARGHTETMSAVFPELLPESLLFMLTPHMHYVGTDFRVTLERDGETSCLIQDPSWDFDWQLVYNVDGQHGGFPTVRAGDRIELRCTYDNSLDNPALVEALASFGLDEPIDLYLGDSGLNEMCMLIYGVAIPR
ncbi:MAG: hypothetical protein R6X02_14205 [Enhygromyxa sp.]